MATNESFILSDIKFTVSKFRYSKTFDPPKYHIYLKILGIGYFSLFFADLSTSSVMHYFSSTDCSTYHIYNLKCIFIHQ